MASLLKDIIAGGVLSSFGPVIYGPNCVMRLALMDHVVWWTSSSVGPVVDRPLPLVDHIANCALFSLGPATNGPHNQACNNLILPLMDHPVMWVMSSVGPVTNGPCCLFLSGSYCRG